MSNLHEVIALQSPDGDPVTDVWYLHGHIPPKDAIESVRAHLVSEDSDEHLFPDNKGEEYVFVMPRLGVIATHHVYARWDSPEEPDDDHPDWKEFVCPVHEGPDAFPVTRVHDMDEYERGKSAKQEEIRMRSKLVNWIKIVFPECTIIEASWNAHMKDGQIRFSLPLMKHPVRFSTLNTEHFWISASDVTAWGENYSRRPRPAFTATPETDGHFGLKQEIGP